MEWFCGAISANSDENGKPLIKPSGTGTQIDERIVRYFGECFQRVLSGVEVKAAMNLKNPANKPPAPNLGQKELDLAVEAARAGYGKAKNKKGQLKILEMIGGADKCPDGNFERGRSQSTIKAAYKNNEAIAELIVKLESPSNPTKLDED